MDDREKAKLFVFGFVMFIIVAAMMIGGTREQITGRVVIEEGCYIECYDNIDCDDSNENTLDGCAYPGSCSSKCFHETK